MTGQTKEEIAIEFIRRHAPKDEPWMVCYSGGEDSIVLQDLCRKAGVSYMTVYSLMPDPPELLQFIKSRPFPIHILHPRFNFWHGIVKNFPPHRKAAWCCTEIKERPSKKIPLTHRLLGIRAEEGNRFQRGMINQVTKQQIHYHPLFYWLEWEIWDYIEENGLKYCSLYDEGFSRLGCVVCPKRNPKDTARWRERFPVQYRLFEKKCGEWWDRKGFHRQRIRGYAYFLEEFLEHWYQGK